MFETYVHIAYHNELATTPGLSSDVTKTLAAQRNLAKMYVLCDIVQDVKAKNCIIQALIRSIYRIRDDYRYTMPRRDMIELIYEGTVKGSQHIVLSLMSSPTVSKSSG
ncbi:uncharacterized protein M421DRAFT_420042 [Didymella exigua CBS 183.55]|uniref:Uncharacterized protein n=1 Tax=Didymella exigua CBS 183.55 TaxID=1150837 RepID=A0A6A5RP59_9PLEO|nr:uncharacterized protein M421DRAFT_420042 [Didymella exigua CBS 183.55]KAF1928814.1 hypothetical protein M421DRAFT_420042 [Didymella exigua CBS 183.55]